MKETGMSYTDIIEEVQQGEYRTFFWRSTNDDTRKLKTMSGVVVHICTEDIVFAPTTANAAGDFLWFKDQIVVEIV